jgi:hypothetical protein
MNKICFVFILIFLLFKSQFAVAVTTSADIDISVPHLFRLELDSETQAVGELSKIEAESAYDSGYLDVDIYPIIRVYSNSSWVLSVKAVADWDAIESYQKVISDFMLKVNTSSENQTNFTGFQSISLIEQEIASSSSSVEEDIYTCNYRIVLDNEVDPPGDYAISLIYTLAVD